MRDLLIDMDDTKHPFHLPFYEYHDRTYGTDPVGRALERSIRENFKLSDELMSDRILAFYERTDPLSLEPLPGLIDALDALAKEYRLWVITARDESASYFTASWIDAHLKPEIFADRIIHTSSDRFRTKRSKLEVARAQGLDIAAIIEDSLDTAREFAAARIPVYLVPYPWNVLNGSEQGIVRAASIEAAWPAFARALSTQI